jgi:hypothetical protein
MRSGVTVALPAILTSSGLAAGLGLLSKYSFAGSLFVVLASALFLTSLAAGACSRRREL